MPKVWDEPPVLDGEVGEHIVMARRHGKEWFVGGMTGDMPYGHRLSLGSLPKGDYIAHIYADPTDPAASYKALTETTDRVTAGSSIDLQMRLAGGVALYRVPRTRASPGRCPDLTEQSSARLSDIAR